ncbi:hypothetical protein FS749_014767 [Ceratobasidium sp. UAMH 11750]|nr:hypothetical protein FS749_014767 [Ceratobasidium sp. UAMH 11750]
MCEYALNFDTNPRNIENPWRILWNEELIFHRMQVSGTNLRIATEYSIVNWGIPKNQAPVLELKLPSPPGGRVSTPTFSKQQKEADRDYRGKAGPPNPLNAAIRLGLRTREALPPSAPDTLPETPAPALELLSISETPSTPAAQDSKPKNPSTVPAKQGKDSYYALDFAITDIDKVQTAPQIQTEPRFIFGYENQKRTPFMPIALELKPAPTRQDPPPGADGRFQADLHSCFVKAYKDIHVKLPAAFKYHPGQKSIIGIAASGPWWSFTVAYEDEKAVTWSKAFICGRPEHDKILTDLFEVAAACPSDPATFGNNRAREYRDKYARTAHTRADVLEFPFYKISQNVKMDLFGPVGV